MVNFGPLVAQIDWRVWGTPANFNRFRILATLLNGSQPNFARCLAVFWAGRLFIHFRRFLPHNGILPGAKFTASSKSCTLLYWQHYCTALEQWAWARLRRWAHGATCIQQGNHHVGHWPTFWFFWFIMAALRSKCGHYIFGLWFLLSLFFSSPNLSRRR